jgi:hypothetical protein
LSDQDKTSKRKVTKRHITFRVSEDEAKALDELAELLKLADSNIIRRGIRKVAEEAGVELPEGVFSDRPGGNWLPKPAALTAINQQSSGHNTAASGGSPAAAFPSLP